MKKLFAAALLVALTFGGPLAHALWADPASMCSPVAGSIYCPTVTQPSLTGDIVGFRLQNATGSSVSQGYVTVGQVFRQGDVLSTDVIVARIGGVDRYVQMDILATWPDASVRHAALTFNTQGAIAGSGTLDVMYRKCTSGCPAAPSPAAPTATALLGTGYDKTATFTWHTPVLSTETSHANVCLTGAATPTGLNGTAVKEYRVVCTVGGGLLKVQYDIRAYADGSTDTDIIPDNTWFLQGGKRNDLNYDIAMSDGFSAAGIPHTLYGRWHHTIKSAASFSLNPQYDVPYLIATGVVPHQDTSRGVDEFAITGRAGNPAGYCRYQCLIDTPSRVSPMTGIGTMTSSFNDGGGGREDIGPEPDWVGIWLLTQDSRALYWMASNADVFGGVQWYFTDESTGRPIDIGWSPYKYPSIWNGEAYPNTTCCAYTGNSGPAFANGNPANPGPVWSFSTDHMSDPTFIPYIISARHYYLENLQGQAVAAFAQDPGDDIQCSPNCTQTLYWAWTGHIFDNSSQSSGIQTRAVAWKTRMMAEVAAYTPDADPLKNTFVTYLNNGVHGLKLAYVDSDEMAVSATPSNGVVQARGLVNGYRFGSGQNLFQIWGTGYDYQLWAWDTIARMNVSAAATSDIKAMMEYAMGYLAGSVTSGDMGFNPMQCCSYWYPGQHLGGGSNTFSTWGQLFQNGMQWGSVSPSGCPAGMAVEPPVLAGFTGGGCGPYPAGPPNEYTESLIGGYTIGRAASMAIAGTWLGTSDIQTWRSYAFLKTWIADMWSQFGDNPLVTGDPGGGIEGWRNIPMQLISAVMPDGSILSDANTTVSTSTGTVTLSPANSSLPAFLSVSRSSAATLNGGNGVNVMLGAPQGTTTLNAGLANDILLAAWNATGTTTFVDCPLANGSCGSTIMYGTSGTGANVFDFEHAGSGQDVIWNFRPGTDTLKVKQNLNGNGITTAAQLITAATTNGSGDGVANLGGGNTITIRRVPPSAWSGSITMVP